MADLTGLNERIANWFEPKPPNRITGLQDHSPKHFWLWGPESRGRKWSPLDFLHDEAANARLLEAMPRGCVGRRDDRPEGGMFWECNAHGFLSGPIERHPDRKRAVVLAFCKWANIPVEEEL